MKKNGSGVIGGVPFRPWVFADTDEYVRQTFGALIPPKSYIKNCVSALDLRKKFGTALPLNKIVDAIGRLNIEFCFAQSIEWQQDAQQNMTIPGLRKRGGLRDARKPQGPRYSDKQENLSEIVLIWRCSELFEAMNRNSNRRLSWTKYVYNENKRKPGSHVEFCEIILSIIAPARVTTKEQTQEQQTQAWLKWLVQTAPDANAKEIARRIASGIAKRQQPVGLSRRAEAAEKKKQRQLRPPKLSAYGVVKKRRGLVSPRR